MFGINFTTIWRKQQAVVISSPEQLVNLEIKYRAFNGYVYPGIRTGKIIATENRMDTRYPIGLYLQIQDTDIPNHREWVHENSTRGFVQSVVIQQAV